MDSIRLASGSPIINHLHSDPDATDKQRPATDRCQQSISGARVFTSVSTRSVQTDDRMCSQLMVLVADAAPPNNNNNNNNTNTNTNNNNTPSSRSSVKPLRERRLPASFWQEPNVPRVRQHHDTSHDLHCSSSASAHSRGNGSTCHHHNSIELCRCAVGNGGESTAGGPTHSSLMEYFSNNSAPTHHCQGVQRPVSSTTVDLATLYLGGLYPDSRPYQQVSHPTVVVGCVRESTVEDPVSGRRLNLAPVYDQHRHRSWSENGQLLTSKTVKSPDVQGVKYAMRSSNLTDNGPSVAGKSHIRGSQNVSKNYVGDFYNCCSQRISIEQATTTTAAAAAAASSLGADNLRRQNGFSEWLQRQCVELNPSDLTLKSEIQTCRSETRPTTTCSGDPLRSLLSSEAFKHGVMSSEVANWGLFPVWRESAGQTARSAADSHLRTAHRYRPY